MSVVSSVENSNSEAVPVQKAAYSVGCSAETMVASTAGRMVVSMASSWVVGMAALMAVRSVYVVRKKVKG